MRPSYFETEIGLLGPPETQRIRESGPPVESLEEGYPLLYLDFRRGTESRNQRVKERTELRDPGSVRGKEPRKKRLEPGRSSPRLSGGFGKRGRLEPGDFSSSGNSGSF